MRRLTVFNNVSVDGYFVDAKGGMEFAHKGSDDPEWNEFVSGNASGSGALLFGRVTYDMMASFWPTPHAKAAMPAVAEGMNRMEKYVLSQLVVKPIVLGGGRTMFDGIPKPTELKPTRSRTFGNGSVLLCYEPVT
jgi:dihydrofolate reductase